ncbi:hypothetical protein IT402_02960 [Candidatus Nomurabacteria bacterium]|nr:hypothetical protein [Candidatus Nomurabacteria bacterium]
MPSNQKDYELLKEIWEVEDERSEGPDFLPFLIIILFFGFMFAILIYGYVNKDKQNLEQEKTSTTK